MNKIIRCHLKKEIETQTVYLAGEAFLGVEGRREKHVGGQSLGTSTGTHCHFSQACVSQTLLLHRRVFYGAQEILK